MARDLSIVRHARFTQRLKEFRHIRRLDEYIWAYEWQLSNDPTVGARQTAKNLIIHLRPHDQSFHISYLSLYSLIIE